MGNSIFVGIPQQFLSIPLEQMVPKIENNNIIIFIMLFVQLFLYWTSFYTPLAIPTDTVTPGPDNEIDPFNEVDEVHPFKERLKLLNIHQNQQNYQLNQGLNL
jgi:hypothetical protein